jgi:alkylation response protein AidB-like acyl-CoA dehydrogenase
MLLTETQNEIRKMARDFAREKLAPTAAERDAKHAFPAAELKEMGKLGFLGMTTPEAYGGSDIGAVAYACVLEEIAAGDGACSTILSVHNSVGCGPIVKFGTEDQKQRFLPKLASGEWIGGFALTEPQAGSDASSLLTRARRDGDCYVLSGTKQFITSGKNGDVIIAFAVTDSAAGKKGISAFIVPTLSPGYKIVRVEEKLGQHSSDTCQIAFDDMRLPADLRLGAEGEGYRIALANLEGGRVGIAAQAVGMARAAFEAARDYAKERIAFGRAIFEHQAVSFRLAGMATEIEAARQLTHHAAQLREAGLPCLTEASMAKLFASEMAERICSSAIQIFGGAGYMRDYPVERIYRDVRVCQIYEGASDIQRMVIARNI